jgi:N-acetylneuraminic acid mutarotase
MSAPKTWTALSETNQPTARQAPWIVPTDAGMLVFGGLRQAGSSGDPFLDDGSIYRACDDVWSPISGTNAPHAATAEIAHRPAPTWTGSELFVWGGSDPNADPTLYQEGTPVFWASRYDAASNAWSEMDRANEPTARDDAARVWTGKELLIWGGYAQSDVKAWVNHDDGARYDPASDRWTKLSSENAPAGRYVTNHFVWTGSELVVWGGLHVDAGSGYDPTYASLSDGGVYDVGADRWTTISTEGSVSAGALPIVWAGDRLVVVNKLDGYSHPNAVDFSGATYDPRTNRWSPMSPPDAALAGTLENPQQWMFWTGSKVAIFSIKIGSGVAGTVPFLLLYDPQTDGWAGASVPSSPPFNQWSSVSVVNGKLVAVGPGETTKDAAGADHESTAVIVFDPAMGEWQTLPLLTNHSAPGIATVPGRLLAWGGEDIYTNLNAPNPCQGTPPGQGCDPATPMITDLLDAGSTIGL